MRLADQNARDRIRDDLGKTLIVEAAAGTGKTTALVSRIVAVLAEGLATLDRIVAVTFTDKAAGELKLRLRTEIERARLDPGASRKTKENLTASLELLEQARIGTIHSFCADLLRERPVEAGIDPLFGVAPRDASERLLRRAFDLWFERALENPGPALRRVLSWRGFNQEEGPRDILRRAARELVEWRDFDAPWPFESFDRLAEIDGLLEEMRQVASLAGLGDPEDYLTVSLRKIEHFLREATRLEEARGGRDYDSIEAQITVFLRDRHWRWRGYPRESFGSMRRDDVRARRDGLKAHLDEFSQRAQAELAPLLREELWPVVAAYHQLKSKAGALDFMDLLLKVRDLLRDNPAVRQSLQQQLTHIFVDEFQDTDPLQSEILLLLASSDPHQTDCSAIKPMPGKLFIVGDPKQSIYRFRRADVFLYQRMKKQLIEAGAELLHLTVSFRATPELQAMINSAFEPIIRETQSQAAYEPLSEYRPAIEGQPSVVALPVPAPYGDFRKIVEWRVEESLPEAIGAYIEWLISESGWKITERTGTDAPHTLRAIEPRHICLLFRRFNDFGKGIARPYVRALEGRHIPHVLVRGAPFHEREEVLALRNALAAIERPEDEFSVYATLKGPLFALTDGALLTFRETVGSLHPFRKVPDDVPKAVKAVAAALIVLRELHRGRNRRPIADTISRLLAATRAHAGFAMWPTGEQALANLVRLLDEARRYESRGEATSFRGFVEQLEEEAETNEAGEAPVVEEGTEGVRLMTVHSAKGLEFPIVILADITCKETGAAAQRLVDPERHLCLLRLAGSSPRELKEREKEELRRDSEEADRLLYVATTRARDLVVIPALGDEQFGGKQDDDSDEGRVPWLRKLNPVIFPSFENRRKPAHAGWPGGPKFGDDSVRTRPQNAPRKDFSVAPGLHVPATGNHGVLWWDPNALRLDTTDTMGLRQMKLLQADQDGTRSDAGRLASLQWAEARARMLDAGAAPSMVVTTATELAAAKKSEAVPAQADLFGKRAVSEVEVEIEEVPKSFERPHGKRFGTLVHQILLAVEFEAKREQIERAARFNARIIGADDSETAAAIDAVSAALASKTILRAREAIECRRECPVLLKQDDGTLVEGIADLAFLEKRNGSSEWVVVDFKTDVTLESRLLEYRTQLGVYLEGIRGVTGLQTRGILLSI